MSSQSLNQKLASVMVDLLNAGSRLTALEDAPASIDATTVSNLQSSVSSLQTSVDDLVIQSTTFAFQATSNLNGNQSVSSGTVLNFNQRQFCLPLLLNYDTANKRYVIQADGVYQFGFKMYMATTTNAIRIGIYKNGTLVGMGGATADVGESIQVLTACSAGDLIDVRCESGSGNVYMSPTYSWFYGYKI